MRHVRRTIAVVLLLCVVQVGFGQSEPRGSASQPKLLVAPFDKDQAKAGQGAWAAYCKTPVDIENSIGMKLAMIPPGEFRMGSPQSEANRGDDEFQHRVRITKPFYLGMHEVTVGQFRRFVEAKSYRTEAEQDGKGGYGYNESTGNSEQDAKYTWRNCGFAQGEDHPVVNVSWSDAKAFCDWLSAQEGKTYRLPTEAEWEYACRAGTTTPFSFGSELNGTQANCNGNSPYGTETKGPYKEQTTPVGSYAPNAFGLYDMHGNVWEWCQDWYDKDYYQGSPTDDPQGPPTASGRVGRGGCWISNPRLCRAAYRSGGTPSYRDDNLGFRVALVPPGR